MSIDSLTVLPSTRRPQLGTERDEFTNHLRPSLPEHVIFLQVQKYCTYARRTCTRPTPHPSELLHWQNSQQTFMSAWFIPSSPHQSPVNLKTKSTHVWPSLFYVTYERTYPMNQHSSITRDTTPYVVSLHHLQGHADSSLPGCSPLPPPSLLPPPPPSLPPRAPFVHVGATSQEPRARA